MSRTNKDKPIWVLKKQEPWRFQRGGYPGAWGNAWQRVGRFTKDWWGQERAKERDALKLGKEPEPTRTRNSVKWHVW